MSDDERPQPRYGEYAPVPPAPSTPTQAPEFSPPAFRIPPARPRRVWDSVLTSVLLLIGVYSTVTAVSRFPHLGDVMALVFEQEGYGEFSSFDAAAAVALGLSITVTATTVLTIALALRRISRRRVAFWVPIVGGVVSTIVVSVAIIAVMMNDPAYSEYIGRLY